MNQSSNVKEFVEIAQKKFPSFIIVALNSDEVWSNTNVWSLKGTKTFHHNEIVSNKIHGNLVSPGCTCYSSSANESKDKSNSLTLSVVNFIE